MINDGLTEDDTDVLKLLVDELDSENIEAPLNLRFVDRKRLREATTRINRIVPYLDHPNLFACNLILKASANVVR